MGQKRKQNGISKLMTTCKVTTLMKKVMAGVVHGNTLRCCMKKAGTWMFSSFESIKLLQEVEKEW